MTLKGTADLGKRHICRLCSLTKEFDKIGVNYQMIIYARNLTEYDRCKKEWAGFEERTINQVTCLCYKELIIYKPL